MPGYIRFLAMLKLQSHTPSQTSQLLGTRSGGVQAELDAQMEELRRSEGTVVDLNARLEEAASAGQASQVRLRQSEQCLQDVQADNVRKLEEARSWGQLAADQASELQQRAEEELASAQ